jgi:NAD(P)-dependent dehydrogenase (short-subunit alcohol dehydrogenase family)
MRASALSAGRQQAYFAVNGIGGPRTIRGTQTEGRIMSKLEGKVAVISGGNSGIGLAIARRFVKEGAHVFIFGRRWDALDKAVQFIGANVTAIQTDRTPRPRCHLLTQDHQILQDRKDDVAVATTAWIEAL